LIAQNATSDDQPLHLIDTFASGREVAIVSLDSTSDSRRRRSRRKSTWRRSTPAHQPHEQDASPCTTPAFGQIHSYSNFARHRPTQCIRHPTRYDRSV